MFLKVTTKKLPRVLFLVPHLSGGGAGRVTLLLARKLPADRYEVHLGAITESRTSQASAVPFTVHTHVLGAKRVRRSALRLLRLVWQIRPDVITSNMAHLNFLVLLLRPLFPKGTRVIVRQNGTVSAMLREDRIRWRTRWLYCALYGRAERVICQTQAMAEDLAEVVPGIAGKTAVLANPVDINEVRDKVRCSETQWTGMGPHVLAVGRLSHEKGFDLLLQAMADVKREFPLADVAIAGAGPQKDSLERLCRSLDLNGQVRFLGAVPAPAEHFRGATVFVVPSRHEGMPNAMLEAAAAGLPIVATPAAGGMVELLRGREGVWLAEDTTAEALAKALKHALLELKQEQRFPHPWIEEFRMERVAAAYEQLLHEALGAAQ